MDIFEFLYDNYLFDNVSIHNISKHKNQLFPVLFFIGKDNRIQKIVNDSWDSKYDYVLFGDYDVERISKFNQLFDIVKSDKNMHINTSKINNIVDYKITIPASILDNYTQLTIKMFSRKELDGYIPIDQLEF